LTGRAGDRGSALSQIRAFDRQTKQSPLNAHCSATFRVDLFGAPESIRELTLTRGTRVAKSASHESSKRNFIIAEYKFF
jgi:hypothetical protein